MLYQKTASSKLSRSLDGSCHIWDLETNNCVSTLMHEKHPMVGFATFSPKCTGDISVSTVDNTLVSIMHACDLVFNIHACILVLECQSVEVLVYYVTLTWKFSTLR